MRDEIIQKLETLVRHTEDIYLGLAKNFPLLLKEMEAGLDESKNFVEDFRGRGKSKSGRSRSLEETIRETKKIIEASQKTFRAIHEQDNRLFASIEEGIGKLSSLDSYIARIHEDSEEMELISLNAMTVALKAGSAGRAFSYITEELKRLSTRTIGLTEDLTRQGKYLLDIFQTFKTLLEEAKGFQSNLFSNLENRLQSSFDQLSKGIERLIDALSDLIERSETVRVPLTRIMEETQLQDIIRQSVDHVIISLKEFKDLSFIASEDELLDELSFFRSLPDLCTLLLDDVKGKIETSLATFHKQAEEAKKIVETLETERQKYIQTISDKRNRESLASLFDSSAAVLRDLLDDLARSVHYKDRITTDSRGLTQEVFRLESTFRVFETIVSRFHSVDIASRIEVAKQEVLRRMTGTVEEMTSLTGRIEEDVKESLDATKEFIKTTSVSVSDYTEVFQNEASLIQDFERAIRSSYEGLFRIRETIGGNIAGFSLFTGKFISLFSDSRKLLDALSVLLDDIEGLKEKLRDIKKRSEEEMTPILARLGKSEWNIENKKLQEIIKRFTIFTHKRTAGDLGGFSVEGGAQAGDITMF